ncbi:MAG: hypothetical protein JW818_07340 [Pirellulales bacterium]|nr:hypothetical protein [Pirellulales bacterium]
MDTVKLTRRLRREIKANPKKAAILGLLFVVAVWFWVPLVWGWFDDGSSSKGRGKAVASSKKADTPVSPAATSQKNDSPKEGSPKPVQRSWEELAQWMDNDLRTRPRDRLPARTEPFQDSQALMAAIEKKGKDETQTNNNPEPVAPRTPTELGLALTSTIVGQGRGIALINGRVYHEGDPVVLDDGGHAIEFRLTAIDTQGIELTRNGKPYRVEVPRSAVSGRIEIKSLARHD